MKRILLLVFLCVSTTSFSQFKKIKSFDVSEEITSCAIDRPGELYLTTSSGQILKYTKDGKLQFVFKNNPTPTVFDPRDGARMFAYYRDKRKYDYLSFSFDVSKSYIIDSAFVIEPWLVCASGDYNLWIMDAADSSLKKINTRTSVVECDVKINALTETSEIIMMREYQGFLFLMNRESTIHILNSMGKLIKSIKGDGITYFNFLGEEFYYLQQDKLKFFDLFSAETREQRLPHACEFALLTDERLFLIQKNNVEIFSINP